MSQNVGTAHRRASDSSSFSLTRLGLGIETVRCRAGASSRKSGAKLWPALISRDRGEKRTFGAARPVGTEDEEGSCADMRALSISELCEGDR